MHWALVDDRVIASTKRLRQSGTQAQFSSPCSQVFLVIDELTSLGWSLQVTRAVQSRCLVSTRAIAGCLSLSGDFSY